MSTSFIGIDLGTTFSAIAHINKRGVPEIIENAEGELITPSVVLFDGEEVIVGSYAKNNLTTFPGQTVEFVKQNMGDRSFAFEYQGKKYPATEISAFILKKLKVDAERRLGESIDEVVISVPAYFGDPQRRATKEAGEIAGLKVLQLINEPTAAAYAYGLHHMGRNQRALVFDLGGGTFDVTVVEISGDRIEVKATDGDHHLGGKDWDDALIQRIASHFEKTYAISPYANETDFHLLKAKAVAAKIALSKLPKVNIDFGCKGKILRSEISRQEFEFMTATLVDQCQMLTDKVIRDAGFKMTDIDAVLLAGGSTRMPMIRNMLEACFGKAPSTALNPDECVALGASVKAALLRKEKWLLPAAGTTWALPSKMQDINVTSHSFGLVVLRDGRLFNSVVIPKNTDYPCEYSRDDYVTTYDNQLTLDLYVLEGEAADPRDCDLIGAYQIFDIPRGPIGGARLKVSYKYNDNQIIQVVAFDLNNKTLLPIRPIDHPDINLLGVSTAMDVAILVDCSGSMSGEKLANAQSAAIRFSETIIRGASKVGVVSFGGAAAQLECALTADHAEFSRKIANLKAYGGNPMWDAIDVADHTIFGDQNSNSMKVIIVLADGDPGNAAATLASANRVKGNGIRIIAVGVGAGVDEAFLRKIVSEPNDYHFVGESFELKSTFINIATQLSSQVSR